VKTFSSSPIDLEISQMELDRLLPNCPGDNCIGAEKANFLKLYVDNSIKTMYH